jgi:hypothetical protein
MDVIHAVGHYGMLLFCLNGSTLENDGSFLQYGDPLRRMSQFSQSKMAIKGVLFFYGQEEVYCHKHMTCRLMGISTIFSTKMSIII